MIEYFIPLLGSYLSSGVMPWIIYPLFALAFLATVPCIIRFFFRR